MRGEDFSQVTTLLYNTAGNNADHTKLTLATVAPPITFARSFGRDPLSRHSSQPGESEQFNVCSRAWAHKIVGHRRACGCSSREADSTTGTTRPAPYEQALAPGPAQMSDLHHTRQNEPSTLKTIFKVYENTILIFKIRKFMYSASNQIEFHFTSL